MLSYFHCSSFVNWLLPCGSFTFPKTSIGFYCFSAKSFQRASIFHVQEIDTCMIFGTVKYLLCISQVLADGIYILGSKVLFLFFFLRLFSLFFLQMLPWRISVSCYYQGLFWWLWRSLKDQYPLAEKEAKKLQEVIHKEGELSFFWN